jgi:Domain of unknown function (DUF4398)
LRRLRYLVIGAQALGVPFSLALIASMLCPAGCGPVEYLSQVSDKATRAVAAAKQAHAEQLAPYEFTAANEYLHKAREEGGTAEYQAAIEYGRRAEDLALRARAIAEARAGSKGAPSGVRTGAGAEPSRGAGDSP